MRVAVLAISPMNDDKQFEQNLGQQEWLSEIANTYLNFHQGLYSIQNEDFDIIYTSQPLLNLLGYELEKDLPSSAVLRTGNREHLAKRRKFLLSLPIGASTAPDLKTLRARNGTLITFQTRAKWYPSIDGKGRILVISFEDVTTLQEHAEALAKQAESDPLTGVLNRLGLEKRFGEKGSSWLKKDYAIFMIDIDWFKKVNDHYSHHTGDELLREIAKTLLKLSKTDGMVVRLGGEEFLVAHPWKTDEHARRFGQTLREEIRKTKIIANGHIVSCTASIGIVRLMKGELLSQALQIADSALREAKESGRNASIVADATFIREQRIRGGLITETDLATAIKNDEFKYYKVPIYNTYKNKVEGFETVLHWSRPDGSIVTSETATRRFGVAFYRSEYIELHRKMQREALHPLENHPETYTTWNLDFKLLTNKDFTDYIISEFAELNQSLQHQMIVEISEDIFQTRENLEEIAFNLKGLSQAGVQIALDNFGKSQISIRSLLMIPIDIIKLDQSIIKNIVHSQREYALLRGITGLLNELKIEIIADGVETPGQAELLNEIHIHRQQGKLYASALYAPLIT